MDLNLGKEGYKVEDNCDQEEMESKVRILPNLTLEQTQLYDDTEKNLLLRRNVSALNPGGRIYPQPGNLAHTYKPCRRTKKN